MFRKMLCILAVLIAFCGGVATYEVKPVQAADFSLAYDIDARTSYSAPDEYNVAKVKMVKPDYVEEYYIQFCKDWFIVRAVECQNIAHMEEMFEELYARQYYGPNPRVTAVRDALLAKGLFSEALANGYKDIKVKDESFAVQYIEQFIKISRNLGAKMQKSGAVSCVDRIVDKNNIIWYSVDVMQHPHDGNGVLGKFQVSQYGEICWYDPQTCDYYNVDDQFVIE